MTRAQKLVEIARLEQVAAECEQKGYPGIASVNAGQAQYLRRSVREADIAQQEGQES